jgi:hypothetical protein
LMAIWPSREIPMGRFAAVIAVSLLGELLV